MNSLLTRVRSARKSVGARWVEIHTGEVYDGGRTVSVDAPYEYIPAFRREGTDIGV